MNQLCNLWILSLVWSMFILAHSRELVSAAWANGNTPHQNNAPIIGVLAQETSWKMEQIWPNKFNSYIAASYVKFVEGGGARAVPIW